MKTAIIVIIILIVLIGGYFLLRGGYQTPTPTPTPNQSGETPAQGTPTSEVKEITVIGNEYRFNPLAITVKAGEKVKLTFKNEGGAPHNLTIEGLGISTKTIGGGKTDVIEFTAPASGTYNFFCSVPGHQAAGMEGDLKVE